MAKSFDLQVLGGSVARNPRIADVFREMKLAENKGTGIAAMRNAMRRANLTPPVFESHRRDDRFVATLWLHGLLDADDLAWLGSFAAHRLSNEQARALVLARRTGEVRNAAEMKGERGQARYVLGAVARTAELAIADRGGWRSKLVQIGGS